MRFLLVLFVVLLTACSAPQATTPTPTSAPAATAQPQPVASPTVAAPQPTIAPPSGTPLPGAFYFIASANRQIMRMEADGRTLTQITFEAEPVFGFDTNASGALVYLIGQNDALTLVHLDGSGRRELASGAIQTPRISPDGSEVIYRLNQPSAGLIVGQEVASPGIWRQATTGMRPSLLLADLPPTGTGPGDDPAWTYAPVGWSPDGARIALFAYDADGPAIPGGELVIIDPAGQAAEVRGPSCCEEERWSADGQFLTMAGGGPGPDVRYGLYRVDAASGRETGILVQAEGTIPLVNAPQYLADGNLYAFVELLASDLADWEYPYQPALARIAADGSINFLGTPAEPPWEVLWDQGANGALVSVDPVFTENNTYVGSLRWVPANATASVPLDIRGSNLRWVAALPLNQGDCANFTPLSFQPPETRSFNANVRDLQARLNDRGFAAGPADGLFGDQTRAALEAFQTNQNLPTTGTLDCDTWQVLITN
jgi:hypothetical protein